MKKVRVHLGVRSYDIIIGCKILKNALKKSNVLKQDFPVFVITSRIIVDTYGSYLRRALEGISKKIQFYLIPDSERAKSISVYTKTMLKLASFSKEMLPTIIAFGGGVVGDLAGFVAATYRRGVSYIQLPTTLLAQVDSAIGGKVAIDIYNAKNIIGSFYQPKLVICDIKFLATLPDVEVRNGLVEVAKYGIIKDRDFFSFIEKKYKKILKLEKDALKYVITKSCAIKSAIVEKDELDRLDIRAILNFGHTLGHAIESASGYSKRMVHGEAVGIGILMASFIATKMGLLKEIEYKRIISLIDRIINGKRIELNPSMIMRALAYDKKFTKGINKFILPLKVGAVKVVEDVPRNIIVEAIRVFKK